MKRRKAATPRKRRAVSRRRVHRNPTTTTAPRASRFKRARRAVSSGARNFLGELASKDGMLLLAAAAATPTAVNMLAEKLVPIQYRQGWTGLLGKAAITVGLAYAVDRWAKQRKAAIGVAAGGLGVIIADAVNLYRVNQSIPAAPVAVQDQISQNPAMMAALIDGDYASLNGYEMAPAMGGYVTDMDGGYESYN